MTRPALLWGRLAGEAVTAVALLSFVGFAARQARVPWGVAVPAGALAGAALIAVLAWRLRVAVRVRRDRVALVFAKGGVLVLAAASEEVFWRWFVLGGLAHLWGGVPAYILSTLGFALVHRGRRAACVHLLTGGAFGGVYLLTGSLTGAIAAHATYNLLVMLGVESSRRSLPVPLAAVLPIELRGVEKRFGETWALRGVSLAVEPGEVVAVLGPNGAGKTTAVRIMLGLRRPDAGKALLFGASPRDPAARRLVGATPQETGFPTTVTVREIAAFAAAHFATFVPPAELLDSFGLADLAARQTGGLSGGERRRLAVALAFAGRPRAVFLDEPTTGLDVESRRRVWEFVRAYAADGGTVLLTTHYLEEAEALATRVTVLAAGRIVREGSVAEIKAGVGVKRLRLRAGGLPDLPGAESIACENGVWTIYAHDVDSVIRRLVHKQVPLDDLEVHQVSLEEAFLALTGSPK